MRISGCAARSRKRRLRWRASGWPAGRKAASRSLNSGSGAHVGVGPDEAADADVDVAALDELDEAGRDGVADPDDDALVGAGERGDGPRQDAGGDRRQRADRDGAAAMRRQVARVLQHRRHVERDALERRHQLAAGLGQRHPPVVAIEQADAEGGFELADLHRQRRLRHVQRRRGAGEVPEPGDGEERLDVPQLGRHCVFPNTAMRMIHFTAHAGAGEDAAFR